MSGLFLGGSSVSLYLLIPPYGYLAYSTTTTTAITTAAAAAAATTTTTTTTTTTITITTTTTTTIPQPVVSVTNIMFYFALDIMRSEELGVLPVP